MILEVSSNLNDSMILFYDSMKLMYMQIGEQEAGLQP